MNLEKKVFKTDINGDPVELEFSRLAHQANGSVIGRYGETIVMAAVVMSDNDTDLPFFPLTVDYEERFYAVGKILGSRFIRREGRPSEEATLTARLIDRTIRPLFDKKLRRSIQVTITVLSYDGEHDPDSIALLAASAALAVSDIPWDGPVAGVSYKKDEPNPYDAFFAGPKGKINMIEFGGLEVSEDEALDLFEKAQKEIEKLVSLQEDMVKKIGKDKEAIVFTDISSEMKNSVNKFLDKHFDEAMKGESIREIKSDFKNELKEEMGENVDLGPAEDAFEKEMERRIKVEAIENKKRPDGRKIDEVRDLYSEVGLFEKIHGSGLFIRGDTQILAMTTLGPPSAKQLVETMGFSGDKRFMLHYNFPSYSVGEAGRSRGPGRREIGHGALAQKALERMIPEKEQFPYVVRVVAETLSSNGSTSMATVCATSLSLMDAGVGISRHVAGIAMGLMSDDEGNWEVLTDIQGPEDHYGDMDLKVAGTKQGINAIQMDVKVKGITKEIFEKALPQAKKARLGILEVMNKALSSPRPELSKYAPSIITIKVDPDKIGEIIGPGGKTINGIIDTIGGDVTIDIEDDGSVFISGQSKDYAERARNMIEEIIKEYEVGEIIDGTVEKILDFGAIVEFGGNHSGMIHVSELADGYVKNVKDVVKDGDRVRAKIIGKEANGKIKLSLKGVDRPGENK